MEKALGFVLAAAIVLGVNALFIWGVSVLVSYLFGIDFGFWKTAAALILLSIVGSLTFGKAARNNG